jgi:ABC-type multidrug transport system fused ATPase/permease subunit
MEKKLLKLKEINSFLKKINVKPTIFIFPILFGLLAALFEGGSFGLLIPTIKGIIEGNARFVHDMPYVSTIFSYIAPEYKSRSIKIFIILVLMTFSCVVLKNIFQYLSMISTSFQVWRFSNILRKKIFERYLDFGKLYFDQNNIGRLQEILTGYTRQVALQLKDANNCIYSILVLVIYIIIMFKISWKLTIFIFIFSPLFALMMKKIIDKIKKSSDDYIVNYSSLLKNLSNSLLCLPLIKAYTYEGDEKKRFFKESNLVEENEFAIDRQRELITPLNEIFVMVLILFLLGMVTYFIYIQKEGEVAGYLVYFVILRRSIGSFSAISRFQAIINAISGPVGEISTIFDNADKFFMHEGENEFTGLKRKIEIKGLGFSYPGKSSGLKNINLTLKKGEITAIVGPSGSGKSTLLNILMRFYEPSSGSIEIDGEDIKNFTLKSYLSKFAYVSQDVFLFNDTFKNNLIYGLENISDDEIAKTIKKANLEDLICKLPHGINTDVGDRGVKLSGGEKQKLSIARAILKNADILVLDEATSSLDSLSEKQIQKAIHEVSHNKTSVIIAHRLSTIKHADKIVVLTEEGIVEEGTLEELLSKKGMLYKLWEEQKFF